MSGTHARHLDPGPSLPVMELRNDAGEVARVNAAPVFEGDDDDKPAVKAHAKAVKAHDAMLAEWAKRGFHPPKAKAAKAEGDADASTDGEGDGAKGGKRKKKADDDAKA